MKIDSKLFLDYGIQLSRYEKVRSILYNSGENKVEGGVIVTTHQMYFFDRDLKILKKTKIKKFKQFGRIGFFGSLFIFEDSEAVYVDAPHFENIKNPKRIISKSMRQSQSLSIFSDRMYSYIVESDGEFSITSKKIDFCDLIFEEILALENHKKQNPECSWVDNRVNKLKMGLLKASDQLQTISLSSYSFQKMIKNDPKFLPILAKIIDNEKDIQLKDRVCFSVYVGEESGILNNIQFRKFKNSREISDYFLVDFSTDFLASKMVLSLNKINKEMNKEYQGVLRSLDPLKNDLESLNRLCSESKKIENFGKKFIDFSRFHNQKLSFGQSPYYIRDINQQYLGLIPIDNLSSCLGYNQIKPISDQLELKKIKSSENPDSSFEDDPNSSSSMDGGNRNNLSDEESLEKNLVFLWRFDKLSEIDKKLIPDFSDNETNGVFVGEQDLELEQFEDGRNPMELEDKWGSNVPAQGFVNIAQGYLKPNEKIWSRKLKNMTMEIWFYPTTTEKAIIFSDSGNELMIGYKKGKIFTILNKKRIKFLAGSNKLKMDSWNHLAFSYCYKSKELVLYLQGKPLKKVSSAKIDLLVWNKNPFILFAEFEGKVTEIRFWRVIRSPIEIKDQMEVPLGIVSAKANRVIVKIKEVGERDAENEESGFNDPDFGGFGDFGFSLGDGHQVEEEKEQTWDFGAPAGDDDNNNNNDSEEEEEIQENPKIEEIEEKEESEENEEFNLGGPIGDVPDEEQGGWNLGGPVGDDSNNNEHNEEENGWKVTKPEETKIDEETKQKMNDFDNFDIAGDFEEPNHPIDNKKSDSEFGLEEKEETKTELSMKENHFTLLETPITEETKNFFENFSPSDFSSQKELEIALDKLLSITLTMIRSLYIVDEFTKAIKLSKRVLKHLEISIQKFDQNGNNFIIDQIKRLSVINLILTCFIEHKTLDNELLVSLVTLKLEKYENSIISFLLVNFSNF